MFDAARPFACAALLRQVIDFFLGQKAALDGKGNPTAEDLVATAHALTTVRALLMAGLNRCAGGSSWLVVCLPCGAWGVRWRQQLVGGVPAASACAE